MNDDERKASADNIFITSVLLAQIVIWAFVALLIYSEFSLWRVSPSQNAIKMVIVGAITVFLVWLSVFLLRRGRTRYRRMNRDE